MQEIGEYATWEDLIRAEAAYTKLFDDLVEQVAHDLGLALADHVNRPQSGQLVCTKRIESE